MELFNILNELEELIERSPKVPMTRRVLVDEDRLLDYLDRIRTSMPEELRQARWVIQEREKVITDSKREALRIIEDAEKQLEKRADESEITRKAQERAMEIQQRAEEVAMQIKQGARDYADEILAGLEEQLGRIMTQIQEGRNELKGMKQGK
ncbi:ATPase [Desulfallas sp. Bu1-1]|uniref:ATPase n=1 Tax=Desulfallas sp. Bu1-1 TaxID=2787620 RepID=UPI00189D23AA|nr:ATPase [Desulfallas sp. Bu1-1]MBF7082364.1 ATPase [Desulfallas sp. Bu1-1]